jgi:hypothetical protein
MYNSWVIPLRSTFPYQTESNVNTWMIFDYAADVIYLIDMVLMKPRVMYLSDGFWIRDGKMTRMTYFHKAQFKVGMTERSWTSGLKTWNITQIYQPSPLKTI